MNESKTYRIKSDLVKKARDLQIKYVLDRKEVIDEAEIINALIFRGLERITNEDIEKYLNLRGDGKIK